MDEVNQKAKLLGMASDDFRKRSIVLKAQARFFKSHVITQRISRWVLPWIAEIVTKFPYSNTKSRWIDRLLVISENNRGAL